MKKLILTALLALMTLAAQAATLTYDVENETSYDGVSGNPSGAGEGVLIFARFDYPSASTATQLILTADELIGIHPKTTETGITRARIKTISFKIKDASGWSADGSVDMVCYAENSSATAFPVVNGKYQYLPYETACAAKLQSESIGTGFGEILELTLTFEGEGLLYTGESILLTTFNDFTDTNVMSEQWWDGIYSFNPGHGTVCIGEISKQTTLSGQATCDEPLIPYFRLGYEEEVEKLGPTATEGDLVKGHAIGTKEACDYSKPSLKLPYNPEYQKATTQSLFLKTQLPGLNSADASSETKANIYSITAYLEISNFYPASTAPFEVEVYALNTEATSFPKENNKEVWFDFSKGVHGHVAIDCSEPGWKEIFEEYYGYCTVPVTVVFDEPFTYEGESIVLTWVTTSPNYDVYDGAFTQHYAFTPGDGINHSAYAVNNDATTGTIAEINNQLPYLEIDYKPLTISGGETKTQIKLANTKLGVAKAADKNGKAGNNVYVEFDIEDAANCGTYDLYLGANNKVGSITGTHGIVNFLVKTNTKGDALVDQTLTVKPQTANSSVIDGEMTIAADDIAALFKAPVVTETVGTVVYTSYYYTTSTAELRGAAAVKMTASDNAVTAISLGSGLTIMFLGNGSTGYYDAFEPLIPASATSWEIARDPAQNDGVISFYKTGSVASIPVLRREPQIDALNGSISLKPTAEYTCLKGATVTTDAPATASTTTDSYSLKLQAAEDYRVRFTPESELIAEIELPGGEEKIVMEEDEEYLMFYTTQSATLQYRLEPTAQAEPGINALADDTAASSFDSTHEWTTAEKGYVNLNLQENKGNKVFVRTVDTKGNARLTAYREIKADGTTSGVAEIEADAAAGAEYFNLQGIRVSGELTPGIYIRRQGTTATKVTVK